MKEYILHHCSFTDTSISEIEECFKRFVKRDDIDIILINQNVSLVSHTYTYNSESRNSKLEFKALAFVIH